MTDKELLDLAAKAVGLTPAADSDQEWVDDGQGGVTGQFEWKDAEGGELLYHWNPLTDDGDALRLAVALHIGIRSNGPNHWQNADETIAIWDDHEGVPRQLRQAHDGDPRAATRTAVVRAAAAIGEQMP